MKSLLTPSTALTAFAAVGLAIATSLTAAKPADAFSLSIDPKYGSTENTGVTANLNFTFTQQGNNVLVNLNMTNTSSGGVNGSFVGVTFDGLDGLTLGNYSAGSSNFSKLWNGVTLSGGGFGTYDYGISTPRNSFEGGNANGGLYAGQSALVSFVLSSNTTLNAATVESGFLSGFQSGALRAAARFQQVTGAVGTSDKVAGGISNSAAVPEPTTMAGVALAGAGLAAYRRRRAAAK